MTMLVIGLVGRIGAGKSTVAGMFADRGAVVIDADALAHEVLEEPEIVREIAARFGDDAIDAVGHVRRERLAGLVFGEESLHQANRRDLEAIVHPRVRRRVIAAIAACRDLPAEDGREPIVILDVPLLVQAGWDGLCDRIVVVECEEAVRRQRLAARGWSAREMAARDRAWEQGFVAPAAGAKTGSVDASADPAYTRSQVDRIWNESRGA
jgi:dephospho-CoA kinase